jgi:hypothetical protein
VQQVIVASECIPQDSAGTFAVACKLYQDESKFRWPSQNLAACASPEKMLPQHVRVIHIDHKEFQCRTKVSVPESVCKLSQM